MTASPRAAQRMHIMLVEDNPDDAFLTQEAFASLDPAPHFTLCTDGVDAIERLERALHGQEQMPDLMLLDLNMPRLDGFGVLAQLKMNVGLRALPVLIFSTSNSPEDIRRSYEQYANSYICKPRLFGEYEQVVQAVHAFWMRTARLPY